jgi:hypothetical protein
MEQQDYSCTNYEKDSVKVSLIKQAHHSLTDLRMAYNTTQRRANR